MDQASRSASVERKDTHRGGDNYERDRPKDNGGYGDNRINKSRSRSPRRSQEIRSRSPLPNKGNVLYVGNLNRRLNEDDVRDRFEKYGEIKSIQLIKDPSTQEYRGFGFVEYTNDADAGEAVKELDQKEFDGRKMKVERSKRGLGYERTPGKYLGNANSSYERRGPPERRNHSRGGGSGGDRYHRDRSPGERRYSRSRSGERRRGGYGGGERRYGGRDGGRDRRSRSKERYNNYRPKDRSRSKERR